MTASVTGVGRIQAGRIVQVKGRSYTAAALLGSEAEARRFDGGSFMTLYLSPRHYRGRGRHPSPGGMA